MKKNKCAKIGIAVSVLFLAYLIFFTNIILNHSCIGISVRNIGGALGTDLLVRYFDSEHDAKKFYKSIDVDNYYLTAIDADNSKNIKNSHEWFTSLEYPLVAENTKFVSIGSFESFVDENELMLYSKGEGLDDGYIDKDETDKSADLYDIGADYLEISENCTDEERNFYYSHCMYACSLKHAFHNYELSLESEDSFSERYWLFQLKDLCDNYQLPDIPNTERDEINWIEYNEQYISYINTIKKVVEKIESQEDFSNQEEAAIYAYWANVKIELHNKVNSDSIKVVSIKSFDNIIDTEYYTISVPQYWKAACVHEVIEKDNYNYTLNFYDRESKESGYGGWLFSISLLTEFEDYTGYPDYEILGSVEVYRIGTYNIVVTYPTDVQCSEDMMQQYSEMQECIHGILETISFKDECVFSSEPVPIYIAEEKTEIVGNFIGKWEDMGIGCYAPDGASFWDVEYRSDGTGTFYFIFAQDDIVPVNFKYSVYETYLGENVDGLAIELENGRKYNFMTRYTWSNELQKILMTVYEVNKNGTPNLDIYWVYAMENVNKYNDSNMNEKQVESDGQVTDNIETENTIPEKSKLETYYDEGCKFFNNKQYLNALISFEQCIDYSNAKEKYEESCYLYGEELLYNGDIQSATAYFNKIGDYKDASTRIQQYHYENAEKYLTNKDYLSAAEEYSQAGVYSDSNIQMLECYYQYGVQQLEENNISNAKMYLSKCKGYKDSDEKLLPYYYSDASKAVDEMLKTFSQYSFTQEVKDAYATAKEKLLLCGNYNDSKVLLKIVDKLYYAWDSTPSVTNHEASLSNMTVSFSGSVVQIYRENFVSGTSCNLSLSYNVEDDAFEADITNMFNDSARQSDARNVILGLIKLFTCIDDISDLDTALSDKSNWTISDSSELFTVNYGGYSIKIKTTSSRNHYIDCNISVSK